MNWWSINRRLQVITRRAFPSRAARKLCKIQSRFFCAEAGDNRVRWGCQDLFLWEPNGSNDADGIVRAELFLRTKIYRLTVVSFYPVVRVLQIFNLKAAVSKSNDHFVWNGPLVSRSGRGYARIWWWMYGVALRSVRTRICIHRRSPETSDPFVCRMAFPRPCEYLFYFYQVLVVRSYIAYDMLIIATHLSKAILFFGFKHREWPWTLS